MPALSIIVYARHVEVHDIYCEALGCHTVRTLPSSSTCMHARAFSSNGFINIYTHASSTRQALSYIHVYAQDLYQERQYSMHAGQLGRHASTFHHCVCPTCRGT